MNRLYYRIIIGMHTRKKINRYIIGHILLLLIDLILHVSPSSIFFTSSYDMFSAWRAMLKNLHELHAKYYKRLLYYKGIPCILDERGSNQML